jgi:anti-anti-sigma factor
MPEERRLSLPAVLQRVPEACEFVNKAAGLSGLDEQSVYHCEMAVDEWCTNVVEHGFGGQPNAGHIEISCEVKDHTFVITVRDDGPPFDPTSLPEPNRATSLEERRPGGLGWFFIQKFMNRVEYTYADGFNQLRMYKEGARPVPEATPSPYPAHTLPNGVRVVSPNGRLDSLHGRQLEMALNAQIDAGFTRVLVAFEAVNYISSTGLKALLMAMRRLQERNGQIALYGMSARVREVFEISGFDAVFPIAASADEALALLRE